MPLVKRFERPSGAHVRQSNNLPNTNRVMNSGTVGATAIVTRIASGVMA